LEDGVAVLSMRPARGLRRRKERRNVLAILFPAYKHLGIERACQDKRQNHGRGKKSSEEKLEKAKMPLTSPNGPGIFENIKLRIGLILVVFTS